MTERACKRCGRLTWSPHSPYCREHRPPPEVRAFWANKSRSSRGYGQGHKARRERVALLVASGLATCARCGSAIAPGEPFDLDHNSDRSGYLGPSHRRCNRVEGARRGAEVTNAKRSVGISRGWSREW
jgi:hypothetical protein